MPDWNRSILRTELWEGCRVCSHFRKDTTCAAFPDGIPIVIASGEVDHLVIRPGQSGDTVFEPRIPAIVANAATALRRRPS